jgi:dihydroflavonol-4-reductase
MKVLVTGANGLLGNHLVRALLAEGREVRVLVREGSDLRALEGLEIERRYGDVRDAAALQEAARGCQQLFHAAAIFSYWGHSRQEMMDTARQGAQNAVEAAARAGVARLILTSSAAVLGAGRSPRALAEYDDTPLDKAPDYFASKIIQEQAALQRGAELGVEVVAVNPSVFLGPRDLRPSAGLATISGYVTDPLHLTWPGGVNIAHAEDVARAHLLLAERGRAGERHIVCGENLEWGQVHQALSELCGVKGPGPSMAPAVAKAGTALMELGARLTGKPPLGTRDQANVIGCYFWYKGQKVEALGFKARPTREALVDAVAWWLDSPHITEAQRRKLRPSAEVQARRGQWA